MRGDTRTVPGQSSLEQERTGVFDASCASCKPGGDLCTQMSDFAKVSLRTILQVVADDQSAGQDGGEWVAYREEEEEALKDSTLDLRIAAILCILVAGLAGGLPPLFMQVRSTC